MKNKEFRIPNYVLASKNIRFLNFIIDLIFIYIFQTIIYIISDSIPLNENHETLSEWFYSLDRAQNFLLWSVLWFVYYGLTEVFLSRSLAKYFTNTIVVMEDGSKPKPIDVLARTVLRLVPFEHFTFLQGRKPGLHDEYSKTFVVKKDKLEKSISDFNELVRIENPI
jgi:uncharacterized RDD family membrane protein YckC